PDFLGCVRRIPEEREREREVMHALKHKCIVKGHYASHKCKLLFLFSSLLFPSLPFSSLLFPSLPFSSLLFFILFYLINQGACQTFYADLLTFYRLSFFMILFSWF